MNKRISRLKLLIQILLIVYVKCDINYYFEYKDNNHDESAISYSGKVLLVKGSSSGIEINKILSVFGLNVVNTTKNVTSLQHSEETFDNLTPHTLNPLQVVTDLTEDMETIYNSTVEMLDSDNLKSLTNCKTVELSKFIKVKKLLFGSLFNEKNILNKNTSQLIQDIKDVFTKTDLKEFYKPFKEDIKPSLTCCLCQKTMLLLTNPLLPKEKAISVAKQICVSLRLSSDRVCEGLINQFKNEIEFIRFNSKLKPSEMCGVLLGIQCFSGNTTNLMWSLNIPKKLTVNQTKVRENQINAENADKSLKILQLTDVHLDPIYSVGSDPNCGEPLCCRNRNINQTYSAGVWGEYPCDSPLNIIENAFKIISETQPDIDIIYWTGDVVAHDIWQYTKSNNIEVSDVFTKLLNKYFGNKIIIPVIGNHETSPINSFAPISITNEFSIQWLYNELSKQWSQWLTKDALKTFNQAGYYILQLSPGFRIIVLNTNYCQRLNFWNLYENYDPGNQLKWLFDQLIIAEEIGDNVHIIGHIPPDHKECTQAWVHNFLSIIERFKDIIVGQFYGHTHADELRVFYSLHNSSDPIGYGFIAPSLTTYNTFNPGFRVYDTNSRGIIRDVNTYYLNLTEANQILNNNQMNLNWKHEYSMSRIYSINSFSYNQIHKLVNRFKIDGKLFIDYKKYYYRFSDFVNSSLYNIDFISDKNNIVNDILVFDPFLPQKSPFDLK